MHIYIYMLVYTNCISYNYSPVHTYVFIKEIYLEHRKVGETEGERETNLVQRVERQFYHVLLLAKLNRLILTDEFSPKICVQAFQLNCTTAVSVSSYGHVQFLMKPFEFPQCGCLEPQLASKKASTDNPFFEWIICKFTARSAPQYIKVTLYIYMILYVCVI